MGRPPQCFEIRPRLIYEGADLSIHISGAERESKADVPTPTIVRDYVPALFTKGIPETIILLPRREFFRLSIDIQA